MLMNTKHNLISEKAHPRKNPEFPKNISSEYIKSIFKNSADFVFRSGFSALDKNFPFCAFWIDGLISSDAVSEDVIRPLVEDRRLAECQSEAELIETIMDGAVYACTARVRTITDDVVLDLLNGFSVVVFDSSAQAISFETRTPYMRGVEKPNIEKSVKGAKDSFVETMRMNTSLVRRKIRSAKLSEIDTRIGRESGTFCALMYIDGIAKVKNIKAIQKSLDSIDIDGLLTSGALEEALSSNKKSLFPQIVHTERPDKFSKGLLDGHIGLIVDGIPVGFLLPATLADFLHVPEEEAQHFIVTSTLNILRWTALIISLTFPALFVAISMYHQEMIPTSLLQSMIEAKQAVPFSVFTEVLLMLLAFELLQEAGLRLPDPIGQTVSIIGGLIVGQSAVEAAIVSAIAVIVVAFSGICGYTVPSQDLAFAFRIFRVLLVIAAAVLGLFGVFIIICILILHLCSIVNLEVAYTSPFTDTDGGIIKEILAVPISKNKYRDPNKVTENRRRQE